MMSDKLKGDVVAFSSSTIDLYYGCPDLDGAEFLGTEIEEVPSGKKVQLKFRLKSGKEWTLLLLQNIY